MKAFPILSKDVHPDYVREQGYDGMDLRDYFAAKAMQALVQSVSGAYYNRRSGSFDAKGQCKIAYQIAEAMMEARK